MIHKIQNEQGKEVGFIEGDTYYTIRDFKKNQIFHHYDNAVGVDVKIIRQLVKNNVEFMEFTLINFNSFPFKVRVSLHGFLKESERVCFFGGRNSTPQRILSVWKMERR